MMTHSQSTADTWRQKAEQARRLAQEPLSPQDRHRLAELADELERCAVEAEERLHAGKLRRDN